MENMQNCSKNGPGRAVLLQNCSKNARKTENVRKCIRQGLEAPCRNFVIDTKTEYSSSLWLVFWKYFRFPGEFPGNLQEGDLASRLNNFDAHWTLTCSVVQLLGVDLAFGDGVLLCLLCVAMFCYVFAMLCYVFAMCLLCVCYVLLCFAMFCYVLLCCAMFCYVLLCCAMLCYVLLFLLSFCYVLLCFGYVLLMFLLLFAL